MAESSWYSRRMRSLYLLTIKAPTSHLWVTCDLRGWEESLHDLVQHEEDEYLRCESSSTLEGWMGAVRVFHAGRCPPTLLRSTGKGRDWGIGEEHSVSPAWSGPGNPTGVLVVTITPLSVQVLQAWEWFRAGQIEAGEDPECLKGSRGLRVFPILKGATVQCGNQWGWLEIFRGSEIGGIMASVFTAHLAPASLLGTWAWISIFWGP